mmetsp:Transcript_34948/g.62907  ORF Transcript_34948/g.62907 Transcript_34948/m.62907 type:complete len:481 (+) Transcript_34948:70-1512(+)
MKPEVRNAVIAACAAMFVEGFYATVSFPFASFMVEDMRGRENLGTMTGLFFTAFPIGSLLTAKRWGDTGNIIGRRNSLLISVSCQLVLTLGMAFCPIYEIMVFLRFLQGFTNCTLPMTRTTLRERIQQLECLDDEVRAFSLLQTAYAASVVSGPAIGGFLYGLPAGTFILPWGTAHLLCVVFYCFSLLFNYMFMVETVDLDVPNDLRRQSSREVKLSDDMSMIYYMLMVSGHSYVFTGWEVGYPLLARNKELQGWSSAMIGITFLVGSIGLLLHTLFSYPIMVRSWGLGSVWSSSWLICIVVLIVFPRLVNQMLSMGYAGHSTEIIIANYVAQLFVSVLQGCNFTTLQFILNRLIAVRNDSEYALPLANGWSAALQAVARAISPSFTGTFMTSESIFDGNLSFDALAVIGILCCFLSGWVLQKSLGKKVLALEHGGSADVDDYKVLRDEEDAVPGKSSSAGLDSVPTTGQPQLARPVLLC